MYPHEVLTRPKSELIVQIYTAMKESPLKDDLIHIVHQDMVKFSIDMSDESISLLSKKDFKKSVKTNMRKLCFQY